MVSCMVALHTVCYTLALLGAGVGVRVRASPGDMLLEEVPFKHLYAQSFKRPYVLADNKTLPFFDLLGDAHVTGQAVRLTPVAAHKKGAIWAQAANALEEWSVQFTMNVTGAPGSGHGSEGMAFWYVKERAQLGPIFGSRDKWTGMGIFFDSFDNDGKSNNPAVLAVYNNGGYNYNFAGDGEGQVFAHCYKDFGTSSRGSGSRSPCSTAR